MQQHFTIQFLVDQTPEEVFTAINHVRGWWSAALEGNSNQLNDVFSYRHGTIHYSKHQLIEVVPHQKLVWLTLESKFTFVPAQEEWTGTKLVFEISTQGHQTKLVITHEGLVPELQCFEGCSKGWTYYLQNSLLPLITTGKGNPDKIEN